MSDCTMPDVYEHLTPVARKVHKCCECGRDRIRKGDLYHLHKGLWDGYWATHKRCNRCEWAALEMVKGDEPQACVPFCELRTWFKDRGCWRRSQ